MSSEKIECFSKDETYGIGKSITNALLSKKSSSYSRLIGDNKNPVLIFVQ